MDSIKPQVSPQEALLQNSVERVKNNINNPKKLIEASKEFESLFVYFLLKNMRKTVMKSGLWSEGYGGEIMQGLFDQNISQKVAQHSSLGIAELVVNQLKSKQLLKNLPTLPVEKSPIPRKVSSIKNTYSYQEKDLLNKLKPFNDHIQKASRKTGVNADLIRAVIMTESSGNPKALSSSNAKGLMQLMDTTAVEVGVKNTWNPKENILGGAKYLSKMLKKFNGNLQLTLAAYNAGPTVVEKYQNIPPFRETQLYVKKVMNFYLYYRKQKKPEEKMVF